MFSKFVLVFLSPLGSALCLFGIAILLAFFRRLNTSLVLSLLAFAWLWVWSMPITSHQLRGVIEYKYSPLPISEYPIADAMVVLGGGVEPPLLQSTENNLGAAADRLWYAVRLFRAGKAPLVLLSGGADIQRYRYSEARAMAAFIRDMGVPDNAILLEEESRNTRENAVFSSKLLRAQGVRHVLLVTSALHMPRAIRLFSEQGLNVEPAPTDYESDLRLTGVLAWLPDGSALEGSGRAIKELVGLWIGY